MLQDGLPNLAERIRLQSGNQVLRAGGADCNRAANLPASLERVYLIIAMVALMYINTGNGVIHRR
jgi:hypothetical protein